MNWNKHVWSNGITFALEILKKYTVANIKSTSDWWIFYKKKIIRFYRKFWKLKNLNSIENFFKIFFL